MAQQMRDSYEFNKPVKPSKPTWLWCFMFMAVVAAGLIVGASLALDNMSFQYGLVFALFVIGAGTSVIGFFKAIFNSAMQAKGKEVFGIPPVIIVLFGALLALGGGILMFIWKT